jgi:hypothetical protein
MAFDQNSNKDCKYGIAEQTTWGTGVADDAAVVELSCNAFNIDPNVKVDENPGAHATRNPIYEDAQAHSVGCEPKVPIAGPAKLTELTHFLAGFFQNVSEGATTPYAKTFTPHATQPDFTTDAGFFYSIFERDPVASRSGKMVDAIIASLTLSCEEGGRLMYSAEFHGRGAVAETSNPSGTWTISTSTFWRWHELAIATINFGAGAQAIHMRKFEIKLIQELLMNGHSGGDFETFLLGTRTPEFTIELTKDAQAASAKSNLRSDTAISVRIGWGNGTPGTASGDLDIQFTGKLTEVPNEKGGILSCPCKGKILGATAAAPITVVLADAVDRGY